MYFYRIIFFREKMFMKLAVVLQLNFGCVTHLYGWIINELY